MNDDKYITAEKCLEVSGKILTEIRSVNGQISEINGKIDLYAEQIAENEQHLSKIKISLYGEERAGKVEGGLVNMVREFHQGVRGGRWFIERIILPIAVPLTIAWLITRVF